MLLDLGAGLAVCRLTRGPRDPYAPMFTVGVDATLRFLSSGTMLTLPLTASLNL
jgi:hypothetical protein